MLIRRSFSLTAAAVSLAAPLAAQGTYCYRGPGVAFGVEGYQCANCGFKTQSDAPSTYTFYAEPVVTQAASNAPVSAGDVIVAVDGNPITTQAGADRFTYPKAGAHTLTIRRGRDQHEIRFDVQMTCGVAGAGARGVGGASTFGYYVNGVAVGGSGVGGGVGTAVGGSVVSGSGGQVRVTAGSSGGGSSTVRATTGGFGVGFNRPTGRFGFAVECHPSCKAEFGPNGEASYKYDGYPSIVAVRPGSAADRAGLRPGDEITKVEGKSIVGDAGILQRAEQEDQIHLTVRRDGKDMNVVMVVTP